MIDDIDRPLALVDVRWLTAAEGGRRSGPPTAPVYMANCLFPWDDETEIPADWQQSLQMFSILLQRDRIEEDTRGSATYRADFLAPDLVADHLVTGARVLVTEGPKLVGVARVSQVFHAELDRRSAEASTVE